MKAKTFIKKLELLRQESISEFGCEPEIIIYTPFEREIYGRNSWCGYGKF